MNTINKLQAQFSVERIEEKAVFIVDNCEQHQSRSVTNDAERVCKLLFRDFGNRQIFYKDSAGTWDELVHHFGVFREFKFGIEIGAGSRTRMLGSA